MSTRESTESRRQQIVEACLELLKSGSLEALSTRRIAEELGLSQPALFRHFSSMEQLLIAAVAHAKGQIEGELRAVLEAGGPALLQLRMLARAIARQAERMPGLPRLLLADSVELADGVRASLSQLLLMLTTLAAELFRQAQQEGEVSASIDARRAGKAWVALIQGVVLQWQLGGRKKGLEAEVAATLDLLLEGTQARAPSDASSRLDVPKPHSTGALERLDVRPLLKRGVEPLEAILAALLRVGPGGLILLLAPFRPAPLIALLKGRGHQLSERPGAGGLTVLTIVNGPRPALRDLSELPPPEPLEQVLLAASQLAVGDVFLARLPRQPRWLLPELERRGLDFELLEEEPEGAVLLRIIR